MPENRNFLKQFLAQMRSTGHSALEPYMLDGLYVFCALSKIIGLFSALKQGLWSWLTYATKYGLVCEIAQQKGN